MCFYTDVRYNIVGTRKKTYLKYLLVILHQHTWSFWKISLTEAKPAIYLLRETNFTHKHILYFIFWNIILKRLFFHYSFKHWHRNNFSKRIGYKKRYIIALFTFLFFQITVVILFNCYFVNHWLLIMKKNSLSIYTSIENSDFYIAYDT